jgi:hypothetical protein
MLKNTPQRLSTGRLVHKAELRFAQVRRWIPAFAGLTTGAKKRTWELVRFPAQSCLRGDYA